MPNDPVISADGHSITLVQRAPDGNLTVGWVTPGSPAQGSSSVVVSSPIDARPKGPGDIAQAVGASLLFAVVVLGLALRHLSSSREKMGVAKVSYAAESNSFLETDTPESREAFLARYGQPFSGRA